MLKRIGCFGVALWLGLMVAPAFAEPVSWNGPPPLTTGSASLGADPMFIYSFVSDPGYPVVDVSGGLLLGDANGDGTYTAVSGNGAVSDGTTLSLISNPNPPSETLSPSGFFLYDDQLLPGQNPSITNGGLLFSIVSPGAYEGGATEINIFSNGPGPGTYLYYANNGFNVYGTFTLTAVPEPSRLVGLIGLCGMGVVVLGWRLRRD